MNSYETIRQSFKPKTIHVLLIAESPPPAASVQSSRQFYRHDIERHDDRLFTNTIKALYPETTNFSEQQLEANKQQWLERFKNDGYYMIEALKESQPHETTKKQRQQKIADNLPRLIEQVHELATKDTRIILIKSNVYDVAAKPLRQAGFTVINTELVDYPGHFNQRAYREKLAGLLGI